MKVEEYIREDCSNPCRKWFNRLDSVDAVKVVVAIIRTELGNTSNIKWLGMIGESDRLVAGCQCRGMLAQRISGKNKI